MIVDEKEEVSTVLCDAQKYANLLLYFFLLLLVAVLRRSEVFYCVERKLSEGRVGIFDHLTS